MARDGIYLADNLRDRLNSEIKQWGKKKDFAVAADVDITTISRYISGKTSPTAEALRRMADALGVRSEWLRGLDDCRTETEKRRADRIGNRNNDPRVTPLGKLLEAYGYRWKASYLEEWPFQGSVRDCLKEEAEVDLRGDPVPEELDDKFLDRYYYGSRIYEYKTPKGKSAYIHEDNFHALERQIKSTIVNFVDAWEGAGPSERELGALSPKGPAWITGPEE